MTRAQLYRLLDDTMDILLPVLPLTDCLHIILALLMLKYASDTFDAHQGDPP